MSQYDLIIIGSGPAGLTASIYATRYKLNTLVISKERGGLAATAHKICNFPSYIEITGLELMEKMLRQAESLNIPIIYENVVKIKKEKNHFKVQIDQNKNYISKKLIFATGTERRKLNVKGEENFLGRGVSYCATCDAPFFKNKIVAVIGGSDAALTSALLLSEYTSKIYIIYRKDHFFKAEPAWIDIVKKNKKIIALFKEEVVEILGESFVEGLKLKSGKKLKVDGIFIEIGSIPNIGLLKSLSIKEEKGYIITDKNQKTNLKGFYAAGDITNNELKQIVTAASQGAIAAFNVYNELKKE